MKYSLENDAYGFPPNIDKFTECQFYQLPPSVQLFWNTLSLLFRIPATDIKDLLAHESLH